MSQRATDRGVIEKIAAAEKSTNGSSSTNGASSATATAPTNSFVNSGVFPDRRKALDAAVTQIERNFGKGSIMRLGEDIGNKVEVIPTG